MTGSYVDVGGAYDIGERGNDGDFALDILMGLKYILLTCGISRSDDWTRHMLFRFSLLCMLIGGVMPRLKIQ